MKSQHLSLTLFAVCFLAGSMLFAETSTSLEDALAYASKPPSQRERSQAVEMLLQAEAHSGNPNDKAIIFQHIAKMYAQSYNSATEKKDLPAAITYCEKSLANLPDKNNLLAAEVQVNLAAILRQYGKIKEASTLCSEVVGRSVDEILKGELTPEVEAKLRRPKARDADLVAMSPDLGNRFYQDRLDRYNQSKAQDYLRIQKGAVMILANAQYQLGGLPALMQLEKEMKSDSFRAIVRRVIAEHQKK